MGREGRWQGGMNVGEASEGRGEGHEWWRGPEGEVAPGEGEEKGKEGCRKGGGEGREGRTEGGRKGGMDEGREGEPQKV